jgi:calcineurin-like phosphoesterase family protein
VARQTFVVLGVEMSETFFTGCTHFGHANIIKLCNRPFHDVEEMNERLITNWNHVVGL